MNIRIHLSPIVAVALTAAAVYTISILAARPRDLGRVAEAITNSVYVATATGEETGGGSGTAFVRTNHLGERLLVVVTAGHVMENGTSKSQWHAVFSQGAHFRWTNSLLPLFYHSHAPADVGVFLAVGDGQPDLPGAQAKVDFVPPAGTPIFSVSSPLGPEQLQSVDCCTLAHAKRAIRRMPVFQFSCVTYPGSSGGGVYTAAGGWIGIITHFRAPGIGFACPATACHALLSANGLGWVLDPSKSAPSRDLLIRQVTK